jgi:predicted acylesterase/phospholipase RssA
VVLQGGGARLCLLMAVCDVLKRLHGKELEITRVAGSSAGAIAAVMLSAPESMETFRERTQRIGRTHLKKFKTFATFGALRVASGNSYFNKISLTKIFDELFCKDSRLRQLSDLAFPVEVFFTDLYSLKSRSAKSDEAIPHALAQSCNFPFAFVGYKAGNAPVDGGLSLNLPVDEFKRDESRMGRVIAISFATSFETTPASGLLHYTQQLFSAAIQGGVARSIDLLGAANVFSIETQIGTFEFEKALTTGLDTEYKLVVLQFESWLRVWLRSGASDLMEPVRPVLSSFAIPAAFIREIDRIQKYEIGTKAIEATAYDTAIFDDAGAFSGLFRSRFISVIEITRPVHLLQYDFEIGREGTFLSTGMECSVVNTVGVPLDFSTNVQELTTTDSKRRQFRVYLTFDPTLTPESAGQPYRVELEWTASETYPEMGRRGEASTIIRWQGPADLVRLAVAFPRVTLGARQNVRDIIKLSPDQLKAVDYHLEGETLIASTDMPYAEAIEGLRLKGEAGRYLVVGRQAKNVRQGEGIGFVIE